MTANVNTATGNTSTPQPGDGNQIVPNPPSSLADVPFPMLVLASLVVGAGIYYVAKIDAKSGWLLAFIILMAIAFAHPNFSSELTSILKTTGAAPAGGNTPASSGSPNGVIVGPNGPIRGG